jgi:hypothetical protein
VASRTGAVAGVFVHQNLFRASRVFDIYSG